MDMSDLIRRQDAVEALEQEIDNATPINGDLSSADGHYRYALRLAKNIIESLPSAEGGDAEVNPKSPYMQQSPNNGADLISRADAIEALRGLFDMRKSRAKVIVECFGELLNALPSSEPTGWIPVTERLPSNNGCVLVTIDDAIEFGKYEDGEWSIWVCEHWDEWDANGVIAWMPLPEPYKGGDDE